MPLQAIALAPARQGEGYNYIIDEDRLIVVTSDDGMPAFLAALDSEPEPGNRASQWAGSWVGTTDAGQDIYVYDRLAS